MGKVESTVTIARSVDHESDIEVRRRPANEHPRTRGRHRTAFAVALHHDVQPTRRGGDGVGLLVLGGLGLVWAGIFPWKMVDGVPTETASHVIGAVMVFTATGLGLIVFSRRMIADPRWRDLASSTMLTGIAVLLMFVAVGFFAIDHRAPLHAWAGLLQRVLCAVWFTCLIVLALRLRSGRRGIYRGWS